MLKKNDVIEIEIDGIGCNGEGIAHVGGYTVFIRTALPGEKVRAPGSVDYYREFPG